jgi:hypothetical protein
MRFKLSERRALSSGEPWWGLVFFCFVLLSSASSWMGAGVSFGGLLCRPADGGLAIRSLIQGLKRRIPERLFILVHWRFETRHL